MTVNIPQAGGVPGIPGPPDWFPPGENYNLDDVRWNGATKITFGSGAAGSNGLRAIQAVEGGQRYVYLSFRAAFVQALSDQHDIVYLGLHRTGTSEAMVIRMQVHGPGFTPSGPPSANPPANLHSVQISTRSDTDLSWMVQAMSPSWIDANARAWLQSAADLPMTDPNNRWAIQLRIPAMTVGSIDANSGPNLATDFNIWYVIHGSLSTGAPVILADYRTSGSTTEGNLVLGNYPLPFSPGGVWDQFLLTSGPASFGGVAIRGNGYSDIVVQNSLGTGTTIANGQSNTFIVRPRNYRATAIPAGDINATIRIANWGSVAGNPELVNWTSGVWDYVSGNSATNPVISTSPDIATLDDANPPATNNQISLTATMNLGADKSRHQCIFVTLSGNNLNFLNDSAFQNMSYDHASLLEREAEISVVGLTPFSPRPRDVYLAIEKMNMARNLPGGIDEGRFLESTMDRLIAQGGALARKLQMARRFLSEIGDGGSRTRLTNLLRNLRQSLAELEYRNPQNGMEKLDVLIAALSQWLLAVKENEGAAMRLAALFDALADLLLASGVDQVAKLAAFIAQLNAWLSSLDNDPASAELAPTVLRALRAWLATLADGGTLDGLLERLENWLDSDRPVAQLPAILNALREFLSSLSEDSSLRMAIATFSQGTARWLRGQERLDTLVNVLSDANLTQEELDQLFPTFRVHAYYDTGERITGADGNQLPVLRSQSSFGIYTYHEGSLEGWQTSLQNAQRIADNLYLLSVPNNGTAKVNVRIQGVSPGEDRIPEDPIVPIEPEEEPCGCLCQILRIFGIGK